MMFASETLVVSQFSEPLVVHAHKMSYFVNHGDFNLLFQLFRVRAHCLKSFLKQEDGVRKQRRRSNRSLCQGNALEEAEELAVGPHTDLSHHPSGRPLPNGNDDVVKVLADLFRHALDGAFHNGIEFSVTQPHRYTRGVLSLDILSESNLIITVSGKPSTSVENGARRAILIALQLVQPSNQQPGG